MNELKGIKTTNKKKKSSEDQLPKVESKRWILLPLTLLFGVPF